MQAFEGFVRGIQMNKLRLVVILASLMMLSVYFADAASAEGVSVYDWLTKFNRVVFGITGAQVAESATAVASGGASDGTASGGSGGAAANNECQKLYGNVTAAYGSSCGNAKYNHLGDLNGDKIINAIDLSLLTGKLDDAAWCSNALAAAKNPCVQIAVAACADSDGGRNYYVNGQLTFQGNTFGDSCESATGLLVEGYCSGNGYVAEKYFCLNGCRNGACINESSPLCTAKKIAASLSKTTFAQDEKVTLTIKSLDSAGKSVASKVGFSVTQNGADVLGGIDDFHYQTPADTGIIRAVRTFNYAPGNYALRFFQVDQQGGSEILCNDVITSGVSFTVLPKSVAACTDSDGGKDYYTQGYSKGKPNPANDWTSGALSADTYDICAGGKLYEYYCDDATGYLDREIITCKNDCADGACLKEPRASVVCQQLLDTVKASYGKGCGDAGYDPVADVNRDQKVNALDLSLLRLNLNNSLWCQAVFASPQPTCVEEVPACTDSDYGKDYYVKGVTFGLDREGSSETRESYDYCYVNNENLYEYYCDAAGIVRNEFYNCPNGCSDGACVENEVPAGAGVEASLPIGGRSYKVVNASDTSQSDFPVFVDYNADGAMNAHLPITGSESGTISKNTYFYLWGYGVMQYMGADSFSSPSHLIRFRDVKTGNTLEMTYQPEANVLSFATLQLGGKSYGVSASVISSNDFDIKVDMDGSGVIGDRSVNIVNNELVPVQKNDYVYLVGYGDLVRYTGADPSSNPSHAMRFQDVSTGNMMEVDYTVTGGVQCTDSDGGKDYYTKGAVTGAWPGHSNIETETDSCVQSLTTTTSPTQPPITVSSSDTLAEIFCQDSRIAVSYKVCENGCQDGACQKEAPPSFPDKFSGAVKLYPGWNLLGAFLLDGSRTTYTFNDCDDSGNVLAAYYYDQDTDRYVDMLTTSTEKQQPVEEEKAQPSAVQERKQVEDQTPPSSGGGGGSGGTGTGVVGTLEEGQLAVYTLYGRQYEIRAEYIGSQTARLSVNGEVTIPLHVGESYTLADGSVISIAEIKTQEIAGGVRQVKFLFHKSLSYASHERINSFWLKVARSCELKFELDEPYQWISAVNREGKQLAKGWNLLAVVPDMVGLTTDEFSGTCNMQKAYGWDPESKSWENLKYGSLEKKAVGYGFAAKVDNDCMLEQPALSQTATAQVAADQPPQLPND